MVKGRRGGANVVLPTLTKVGHQAKIQVFSHVFSLPNCTKILARGANTIGAFGLVRTTVTILYQCGDLALILALCAFTISGLRHENTTH